MGVVSVIDAIIALYPNVLRESFQDMVDILVGWHLDSQPRPAIVKKTAQTLISMRAFWVRDMDYSITLISQFLEDMEEYRKDMSGEPVEGGEEGMGEGGEERVGEGGEEGVGEGGVGGDDEEGMGVGEKDTGVGEVDVGVGGVEPNLVESSLKIGALMNVFMTVLQVSENVGPMIVRLAR